MILTEKQVVNKNDPRYEQLLELTHLSKNLYNASLYDKRQHYFATKKHKSWQTQSTEFVKDKNLDYYKLPTKLSKCTIEAVDKGFKSFFSLLKKKQNGKYDKPVRLPGYLPKDGHYQVIVPVDAISIKPVKDGDVYTHTICKKSLDIKIKSKIEKPRQVRFHYNGAHIIISVLYEVDNVPELPDNGKHAAIDIGVDNLATVVTNVGTQPLLFNGKAVKSVNQFFNKRRADLQSQLRGEVKSSHRLKQLSRKRDAKLDWLLHNTSASIVNHLVFNDVRTLVIGYNKEWKQDINIGRVNNQKFVGVPFLKLVEQLEYKCALHGIRVILHEESYTSKCSFLDRERVCKHDSYVGRRVKRGLFRASGGRFINADVNGAFNIMRKVVPEELVYFNGVEDYAVNPLRVDVNSHKYRLS